MGATYYFETADELRGRAFGVGDTIVLAAPAGPAEVLTICAVESPQMKLLGDDTIVGAPSGYDWRAANQAPRAWRRRK